MSQRLYIVATSERGPVKIGISNNPNRRLRTFNTASPDPVSLHAVMTLDDARSIEQQAHAALKLAGKHRHNEWFNVSVDDAKALIERITGAMPPSIWSRLWAWLRGFK